MECMSLLGFAACAPNPDFRARLSFPAIDIERQTIPLMLRRRSSQTTQMAFSAATQACLQAGRSAAQLPAIFASVAGEVQTSDQLCLELSKPDGVISPSAFHNSVQNTVAGYWSIARQCTQPATALAAGHETFAMALLEAWCQLACQGGELLLVCYDERWPEYLMPGSGEPAFATAMVLAAGKVAGSMAQIGRPHTDTATFPCEWQTLAIGMPILATLPALNLVANANAPITQVVAISTGSPGWQVSIHVATPHYTP